MDCRSTAILEQNYIMNELHLLTEIYTVFSMTLDGIPWNKYIWRSTEWKFSIVHADKMAYYYLQLFKAPKHWITIKQCKMRNAKCSMFNDHIYCRTEQLHYDAFLLWVKRRDSNCIHCMSSESCWSLIALEWKKNITKSEVLITL